ncbi:MAG TPA: alpha/beta hydrolase domain-containing protein [Rugosimonospora sp.]|nr:alpha/beta hydrolase domain-containing protein [Rugosimonospora sp.]
MGMRSPRGRLLVAVVAAIVPLLGAAAFAISAQAATTPKAAGVPVVTGPVTGGKGNTVLVTTGFDLRTVGYQQSEFFLSGTARSFLPQGTLGTNGRWRVTPASAAPYTTRIVVDRPINPARFNGTVYVEWLNVSSGFDVAPDWIMAHNELIRDGFAWIGVSAQALGLNATKAVDPVRYAALAHPGDSFAYDIYTQTGRAVRAAAAKILGGLRPRTVLAEGESQSAFRLTTYIDAIQPTARVYDGFLVHSRASGGAGLSQAPQPNVFVPAVVHFRTDLRVPVLALETETDVITLNYQAARQPDSRGFRDWEVAGTAHADTYFLGTGFTDNGNGAAGLVELNAMLNPPSSSLGFTCAKPLNTGPAHYIVDTAHYALNRWVRAGVPPRRAPRLAVTVTGTTPALVLDANGNAKGGIRTPEVDAPVATLSGLGQTGASFCFLFGTTAPFAAAKLKALYPTHNTFVRRWAAIAVTQTVRGFIRPADTAELITAAAGSTVGN